MIFPMRLIANKPDSPTVTAVASDSEELALRRCCHARAISFTDDGTSAVCRTCGTIMPANWFARKDA